jgi:hypothetical protein
MLHETYATETNRPASSTWQTVFVFGESSVQRVDTPELVQPMERDRAAVVQERPMELDRVQAKKDRNREYKRVWRHANKERLNAKNKAYYESNADKWKEYQKEYQKKYYADAANIDRRRARTKSWTMSNIEHKKEYNKQWRASNIEKQKAYEHKRYAANPEKCKADARACKLRNHGCVQCKDWPDPRQGWKHYDGYCWRCFSDKFRDDERVKSRGRVELKVRSYLDSHFPDFVHDQPIHTAHCVCSHRRRVDHRKLIGNTLLCVETDENFHKYYDPDDEEARYHDVIMAWGGKLCFVRFNPHKFNLDDRRDHGPPLDERLERLRAEVTRHIERLERGENTAYLEVHHLYYPEGTPDLYEEQCKPEWLEAGATSI